ncbi:MAG: hypothetical protein QXM08_00425 [Thermofilaceae archaeon]
MRLVIIIIEVLVWFFSFFFFIKHGRSIYEALMLSAFVLGVVDIVVHLLGGDNTLFYIVFINRRTGLMTRIPVTLTWFLVLKGLIMYLSRDFLPRIITEVKAGGEREALRG